MYGSNWRLAQQLPVNLRTQIWAVPGDRTICLIDWRREAGAGMACAPTKRVLRSGLAITSLKDASTGSVRPTRVVVGVAPDDAARVLVHTGGMSISVPVFDGVFTLRDSLGDAPDSFSLR
jgi:hypothetical protein